MLPSLWQIWVQMVDLYQRKRKRVLATGGKSKKAIQRLIHGSPILRAREWIDVGANLHHPVLVEVRLNANAQLVC